MKAEREPIFLFFITIANAMNCNFNGTKIKSITALSSPYLMLTSGYNGTWDETSDTFIINAYSHGLMIDIIKSLGDFCNFTYEIHLRRDQIYGDIVEFDNGTVLKSGHFETFLNESLSFDLILMANTMTVSRMKYIKFLHPTAGDQHVMVIKNDLDERFNRFLYMNPFDYDVWLLLILLTLCPFLILILEDVLLSKEKVTLTNLASKLSASIAINFGGNFLSKISQRRLILVYFFNGIIIWISYRAQITAGFNQKILKMPFRNLNTLIETDYFMTTTSKHGATGSMFFNAQPGTIEQLVFLNNMNLESSFIGNIKGLQELHSQFNRVHFTYMQGVLQNLDKNVDECDLLFVWKSPIKHQFAMGVHKKSKYYESLNWALIKLAEKGILKKLQSKHFKTPKTCHGPESGKPLGFDKTGSAFLMFATAVLCSVIFFIIECICIQCSR